MCQPPKPPPLRKNAYLKDQPRVDLIVKLSVLPEEIIDHFKTALGTSVSSCPPKEMKARQQQKKKKYNRIEAGGTKTNTHKHEHS